MGHGTEQWQHGRPQHTSEMHCVHSEETTHHQLYTRAGHTMQDEDKTIGKLGEEQSMCCGNLVHVD